MKQRKRKDSPSSRGQPGFSIPFWTSLSLEDLAALQAVQPADDLDSISALWPADDDPDELLAYILAERSSRRGIADADPAR